LRSRREFLKSIQPLLAAPFFSARDSSGSTPLSTQPYLQNAGANEAAIRWNTLRQGVAQVRYSIGRQGDWRPVNARTTELPSSQTRLSYTYYQHHAMLSDLEPGVEYSYQILLDGEDLRPAEHLRFRTDGRQGFSFLVFGDSGAGSPEQWELARRMEREDASLVLHTGDLVYPEGSHEGYQSRYLEYYHPIMERLSFFPTAGNHDYYGELAAPYLAFHSTPESGVRQSDRGRYYSFDWGNVHFVSLDSNLPLEAAARGDRAMLDWLENDLRSTRKFWRVVFFHHPPYSSGVHANDPLSRLARELIVPILERHHVPIVFCGHDHNYQRTHPLRAGTVSTGGTMFITSGGGGAQLYPAVANHLVAAGESAHHFLRCQAKGGRLTMSPTRRDGSHIERVEVVPRPVIAEGGVINAASLEPAVASGGIASIFGWHMAEEEARAEGMPLPRSLGGVSVSVGGRSAPLFYVSPGQINAQLPFAIEGEVTLTVNTPEGTVSTPLRVLPAAPAIFLIGQIVTAKPGELVSILLTGLGKVAGIVEPGHPAPESPRLPVVTRVIVRLAGEEIQPAFAGLLGGTVGQYVVEFLVPSACPPREHRLEVVADGRASNPAALRVSI
jgi:uncharacterized protein (TIGR03437 family)